MVYPKIFDCKIQCPVHSLKIGRYVVLWEADSTWKACLVKGYVIGKTK